MSSRKLTLDLHPVFKDGRAIDAALHDAMERAERDKLSELEIIYGKGSGQLRKRVLRFLDRKDVRDKYHRIDKDSRNSGHVYVHFRWRRGQ